MKLKQYGLIFFARLAQRIARHVSTVKVVGSIPAAGISVEGLTLARATVLKTAGV